jgi:hypothetical protein
MCLSVLPSSMVWWAFGRALQGCSPHAFSLQFKYDLDLCLTVTHRDMGPPYILVPRTVQLYNYIQKDYVVLLKNLKDKVKIQEAPTKYPDLNPKYILPNCIT